MIRLKGLTIEKELERFLRKERVYTKFCNAVRTQQWVAPHELSSISGSFRWSETKEGFDFWNKLDSTNCDLK